MASLLAPARGVRARHPLGVLYVLVAAMNYAVLCKQRERRGL